MVPSDPSRKGATERNASSIAKNAWRTLHGTDQRLGSALTRASLQSSLPHSHLAIGGCIGEGVAIGRNSITRYFVGIRWRHGKTHAETLEKKARRHLCRKPPQQSSG